MMVHHDRFLGALLGTACGDAMGLPVEGQLPSAAQRHVQRLGRVFHPAPTGHPGRLSVNDLPFVFPGRYSDDGQQARALVETLAAHGRVVEDDFADRLQAIVARGHHYGWGTGTLAAIERMRKGIPWRDAATSGGRCGNGSVMRVVPLGVWSAHASDDVVADNAARQSRVTHADARCTAAAVAVALAAADAARGLPARALLARTSVWAELAGRHDADIALALDELRSRFRMSRDAAVAWAVSHGPPLSRPYAGVPGLAGPTALFALWCWLRVPWHFSSSVLDAIAAGGDTDTTAAVVGGLVGATAGARALPAALTDRLRDGQQWKAGQLAELCEQAWRRHPSVLDGATRAARVSKE